MLESWGSARIGTPPPSTIAPLPLPPSNSSHGLSTGLGATTRPTTTTTVATAPIASPEGVSDVSKSYI